MTTNPTGASQGGASINDINHMKAALNLARRGLGNVWPNPAVGCVITKDEKVVGRGWTLPGGRPHAETEALQRAGNQANGGTAYVTLEPCNHEGQTPPCSEALIDAGLKRVVIATQDPDKRVAGTGIARLKNAGIEVEFGIEKTEADLINRGFFSRIENARPYITLKIATTLDGKIATQSGESQWITGDFARRASHKLRATHDAVMIGSGTALADDPTLTCRLPGISNERRTRIVLDGRLRMPLDSNLAATSDEAPVLIFTLPGDDEKQEKIYVMKKRGISITLLPSDNAHLDVKKVVNELASRGITRLFVEGGGTLAASLMTADLVDDIAWFRAPSVIGNDGISAIEGLGLDKLTEMPTFSRKSLTQLGEDCLEILSRKR